MKTVEALQDYSQQLQNVSDTPRLDVEILLCEILQISKAHLLAYPEQKLARKQHKKLQQWVQRRLLSEPIAYIVGHQPFWTLDLIVTPATLIPRPETEHLVEWILQQDGVQQSLQILDLGVGSGAIALALASERPLWQIDAVDNSEAALSVVKQNAQKYQCNQVNFYLGSWFVSLPPGKQYHFIVSNPPYIGADDEHLAKLRYEPEAALISDQQGLADLKTIILNAKQYLLPNAYLVVEHGFQQSVLVQELMQKADLAEITAHVDFSGKDRFVTARNLA